jgi:hypothetical protein
MAVNLSFIGGAGWQFFDDSGNPLTGGKVYTYAAGTTTPLATYTSYTGATPNANPIILDAAGRTPQQIWSTEGLLYKYVITTSADVLIRTWDNIGGSIVASDLAQDLANTSDNTKGDALVGFKQSNSSGFLTGATARTVNDKLQESLSVKDFGAVGNGIADDTTAIQAAINIGKSVFFPGGQYKITASLTPSATYQTFFGAGDATIVQGAKNINCFTVSNSEGITIRNLNFQGGNGALTEDDYEANHAVYGVSALNLTIENCRIYQFYMCGIQLRQQKNVLIADNFIYGNWYGDPSASDITLYNAVSNGSNVIIRNNFCLSNNSQGVYISALGGDRDVIITGNVVNTLNNVWQEQTDYSTNMGTPPAVKFSNTLLYRRNGIVASYAGDTEGKVIISNNIIRNTMWNGVYRNNTNDTIGPVIVTSNIISMTSLGLETNGLSAGINFVFTGNSCVVANNLITNVGSATSGPKAAIQFAGQGTISSAFLISNNTAKNCGYGVYAYSKAIKELSITGNSFYDMSVQGLYLAYGGGSVSDYCSVQVTNNYIEKFAGTTSQQAGIFLSFTAVVPPIIADINGNTVDADGVGGFGISFTLPVSSVNTNEQLTIRNNTIMNVVTAGVQSTAYLDARMFNLKLKDNVFYDCPIAYNIGSQLDASRGFVVVEGGNFYNVTTKLGAFGAFATLRFGKWVTDTIAVVYDSALPTTGRWYRGDRVEYNTPSAGGNAGAICVTSGQFGTLSGVTANTTSGSATITVNSSTDLYVGMTVTIAGVTGAKEIASVSTTTVVLTSTCDATTVGAAVANNTPVLKTYGAIAA